MTTAFNVKSALVERGALLDGHFRLSSGRHSDRFVQKFRILEDPSLVEPVAAAIADAFRDARPTIVVSAAIGGIVLGYEVARQLGVKAIFVEKENGVPLLRRGFMLSAEDRALVVEDVVTTGLSVREVIDVVQQHGPRVAGVGVIVKRGDVSFALRQAQGDKVVAQGDKVVAQGDKVVAQGDKVVAQGDKVMARGDKVMARGEEVRMHALLDLPIVSYAADECPQCKAGEPITDPGSRRS